MGSFQSFIVACSIPRHPYVLHVALHNRYLFCFVSISPYPWRTWRDLTNGKKFKFSAVYFFVTDTCQRSQYYFLDSRTMKFMKAQEHLKTMSTPRKLGFGKKTLNKSYRTKPIVIYTAVPFGDDQIANEEATSPMYRTFFRHLVILAIGGLIGYISCWFFIEALAISIENHHEFADSRRFVSKGGSWFLC